ncbi:MAG: hypothetical protein ABTA16_16985 [Niallia sp.]
MKEQKLYICELCSTHYKEKSECKNCEEGHKRPVLISDSNYVSIKNNGSGYPTQVHIKMSNGETITYKR